ncbi:MAG: T9SS type A sorting domain-containing protein, partial [Bacteroidales bacterium]|nr:T9SS type A sorting domain-containing protein [Bacteroidales bacterium]
PLDLSLSVSGSGPENWILTPEQDRLTVPAFSDIPFRVKVRAPVDAKTGLNFVNVVTNHSGNSETGFIAEQPVNVINNNIKPLNENIPYCNMPGANEHALIRHNSMFAVYLEAGEDLDVLVRSVLLGSYTNDVNWLLLSPEWDVLDQGSINAGGQDSIKFTAERSGTYFIDVSSYSTANVISGNCFFAELATSAKKLQLYYSNIVRYFYVPEGSQSFNFGALDYGNPGSGFVITSPTGRVAFESSTNYNGTEFPVDVLEGESGKIWTLTANATKVSFWLSGDVMPYLSTSPDRVMVTSKPALTTDVDYHYLTSSDVEFHSQLPFMSGLESVRYTVYDESGEKIAESEVTDVNAGGTVVTAMASEGWPYSTFTLRVEAFDSEGRLLAESERIFEHPEPPLWWQGDAGRQTDVPEPWIPVQTTGREVSVWGRTYRWGEGPFPESLISQGTELLTGSVRLVSAFTGEGEKNWQSSGFELEESGDSKAIFRGTYNAGNLELSVKTTVEYDGMIRFDLELSPGENTPEVEKLFLEIPLKREHARFFSRSARMGLMPSGEQPESWLEDYPVAGTIGDEPIVYRFVPWLNLRDDHIGIEWFAEQDWHWSNTDEGRKIEIIPNGDKVILRIRFIDKPTVIDSSRSITFGLQSWPAKPWPDKEPHISKYLRSSSTEDMTKSDLQKGIDYGLDVMWNFDWDRQWNGVVGGDYPHIHHIDYPEYHNEVFERIKNYAAITNSLGVPAIGHSGFAIPEYTPDFQIWGKEMIRHPVENTGEAGFKPCPQSPYADSYVTRYKELAEQTGWGGLQDDEGLQVWYCESERHVCGWRDNNGELHGSYSVFATRDLARRLYNVFHEEVDFEGIDHGFVYGKGHEPGAVMIYCDKLHEGGDPRTLYAYNLSDFDLDTERVRYMNSSVWGVPFDLLPKIGESSYSIGLLGRIAWALQMGVNMPIDQILTRIGDNYYGRNSYSLIKLWDARRWVNARPDNFYGYWNNEGYVKVDQQNVYAGFHLKNKGDRMLLAVSNWTSSISRVSVELNLDSLGFGNADIKAGDAVIGASLDIVDSKLSLTVPANGYRLVKIWNDNYTSAGITGQTGKEIKVWPNPSSDVLYIDFGLHVDTVLEVYDLNGNLVRQLKVENDNHCKMSTKELTPGVYMLKAVVQDVLLNQKILIFR